MKPPRSIPSLPFRWGDFVFGNPGKCFPACICMCSKYWTHYEPDLEIPLELNDLERELGDSFYSASGLSLERLKRQLRKTQIKELNGERFNIGLTIEARCPKNLEDLYPFFLEDPPIPLIFVFDQNFTERNRLGDPHAVILHHLDYETEKIYVIDPVKKDLKGTYPYDFNRFKLGWAKILNLTLAVAPLDRFIIMDGKEVRVYRQLKLTEV